MAQHHNGTDQRHQGSSRDRTRRPHRSFDDRDRGNDEFEADQRGWEEHGFGHVSEPQRSRTERFQSGRRFDTQTKRQSWPATGSWQGQPLGSEREEMSGELYEPRDDVRSLGANRFDRDDDRSSNRQFEGRFEADLKREGSFAGVAPIGFKRTDERLLELVAERLTEDHWIDASRITVDVSKGEVTVTGLVPDRETKYRVEEVIDRIFGVTDVVNRLKVSPEDRATAQQGVSEGGHDGNRMHRDEDELQNEPASESTRFNTADKRRMKQ